MILVDTSVWITHFRQSRSALVVLLTNNQVLGHPDVTGELAMGSLQDRAGTLRSLHDLPTATIATREEAMALIESQQLFSRGIGWVDAQLLASALLSRCTLWTDDTRMNATARSLSITRHLPT
jgi:predicted nucleic acid-binding protein